MCRFACLLALAGMLLTGCLYVPTPEHGLLSGRGAIHEEDLEFLTVGGTTRTDVLLRFGEPDLTRQDEQVLAYTWAVTQGYFAAGAGYSGGAGPVPRHYLMLFQFDDQGKLARFERTVVGWGALFSAKGAERSSAIDAKAARWAAEGGLPEETTRPGVILQ